jgi:hypothetical protein
VAAGQFDQFGGPWAPIGAEQTASGYEVAWKVTGADQFTVWNTDNSGNYVSSAFDVASGTSAALQSFETSFHQDLNGDGYIGLVLDGSSGGRTLTAGISPTTLIGGPNDILNGGAGADTFVFLSNFGTNTVNNFTPGTDALQFSQLMFADADAVLSDAQQVGSDVVITHDSPDVLTLHNMQLTNLHAFHDPLWFSTHRLGKLRRCKCAARRAYRFGRRKRNNRIGKHLEPQCSVTFLP